MTFIREDTAKAFRKSFWTAAVAASVAGIFWVWPVAKDAVRGSDARFAKPRWCCTNGLAGLHLSHCTNGLRVDSLVPSQRHRRQRCYREVSELEHGIAARLFCVVWVGNISSIGSSAPGPGFRYRSRDILLLDLVVAERVLGLF